MFDKPVEHHPNCDCLYHALLGCDCGAEERAHTSRARQREAALVGTGWVWEYWRGAWRATCVGGCCEIVGAVMQIYDGYDPGEAPLDVVRAVLEHRRDPAP